MLNDEIEADDYYDCYTDENIIMCIATKNNVCVEIHTNSLENQIETYNSEYSTDVIRLHKEDDEEGNVIYSPIVKKCGHKRNNYKMKPLTNASSLLMCS